MYFNESSVTNGLGTYLNLLDDFKNTNVVDNDDFKKKFKGFYKLRQKSREFYDAYFSFMENHKNNEPTYRETLEYFYNNFREVHYSFCSKLIATINPNRPILDQFVLRWMGYSKMDQTTPAKKRIDYYVNVYEKIEKEYNDHLIKPHLQKAISKFDDLFPEYSCLTSIKKIDCFIWSLADGKIPSILEYCEISGK